MLFTNPRLLAVRGIAAERTLAFTVSQRLTAHQSGKAAERTVRHQHQGRLHSQGTNRQR